MPIKVKKAGKGASKKAKQKVVGKVMHELKGSGRPQKQRVAIAMKYAGLSRKGR